VQSKERVKQSRKILKNKKALSEEKAFYNNILKRA